MKYKICEFGGNTATEEGSNPTEAVSKVFAGKDVQVFPDGYIHVNGEPFGWVVADD